MTSSSPTLLTYFPELSERETLGLVSKVRGAAAGGTTSSAGESCLLASGGGLAPCRAHLPSKGGSSLAYILLLWLDLHLSELHVGSSSLLDLQSLS